MGYAILMLNFKNAFLSAAAFGLLACNGPIVSDALPLTYPETIAPDLADRFSALALACVHQEFPNKISRTTNTAEELSLIHI